MNQIHHNTELRGNTVMTEVESMLKGQIREKIFGYQTKSIARLLTKRK